MPEYPLHHGFTPEGTVPGGLTPEVMQGLWRVSPAALAATLSKNENPKERWVPAPHLLLLSRAIQQAAYGQGPKFWIVTMPPRHGKPVCTSALISTASGKYKRLADVVVGDKVITHLGRAREVQAIYEQGALPCLRMTCSSGRTVETATDHPFMTPEGWLQASDLCTGMFLMQPAQAQHTATVTHRRPEEYRLAGYYIGDGCVVHNASKITCYDPIEEQDILECALALGFTISCTDRRRVKTGPRVTTDIAINGGARDWLRETGIAGKGSHDKTVPDWVFQSSNENAALFIGAYFACDGHVNRRGNARKDACVEFYSVSKELLQGVQRLLLRFGVQSNLRVKNGTYKTCVHKSWRLSITSREDITRFIDRIPVPGCKSAQLTQWRQPRTQLDNPYLYDQITAIEDIGPAECRCLTVDEDSTFTADDFVVHNSFLVSKWAPVWFLENFPHKNVINCGYGANFASEWGRLVRNTVNRYQDQLSFRLSEDSKAANKWNTTAGGGMRTAGVGGDITGKGADFLILDDLLKNAEEASSFTIREKIWAWWTSTARTRVEPKGCVFIVLTRWHEDDIAGRILSNEFTSGDDFQLLNLPAIYDEHAARVGPDPLGRKLGQALWPARYDEEALAKLQLSVGVDDWTSLYQQRPARTSGKGNVYDSYSDTENVARLDRDPAMPLCWALDFNRDPMCSVVGQYREEITMRTRLTNEKLISFEVLQEMALPDCGTLDACHEFVNRTRKYVNMARGKRVPLEIYGDVSGNQRSTNGDQTDWQIVKAFFVRYPEFSVTYHIALDNPAVKARTNAVNTALKTQDGYRHLFIDLGCTELRKDMREVKWKRDAGGNTMGVIDKSDRKRTHSSDALGYVIFRKFGMRPVAGEQDGLMR